MEETLSVSVSFKFEIDNLKFPCSSHSVLFCVPTTPTEAKGIASFVPLSFIIPLRVCEKPRRQSRKKQKKNCSAFTFGNFGCKGMLNYFEHCSKYYLQFIQLFKDSKCFLK